MKLLHVVDTTELRGGGIFASDLARALTNHDLYQEVAVLSDAGGRHVEYEIPRRLLAANGWNVPGLGVSPKVLGALRALVREWDPDIVQAHGGNTLKYSVPAVLGHRTKLVYRHIGVTPPHLLRGVKRMGNRLLMARADRVIPVADAVRHNTIYSFGIPENKVVTIPNGVDTRRIKPSTTREDLRRTLGIPPDTPVLISLGALTWEKDPLAHIRISAEVLDRFPAAVHLIVGDGPLRQQVEEEVRRQGLSRRALILGARTDVADLLAASDVLLFASRPDGMEGMNAGIIEAGMLGVPAAAYSVSGTPEVVVDGVTGRVVPAGELQTLAEAVIEMLGDLEAARALGKAAQERYRSLFDIEVIAPRYLAVYEDLMKS
jgi:glycosyltransferase involved in cell wall biosynthesis